MAKGLSNPGSERFRGFSFLAALYAVSKKGHEELGIQNTQFNDNLDSAVPHVVFRWEYNGTPYTAELSRVEFLEFMGEHLFENRKKS